MASSKFFLGALLALLASPLAALAEPIYAISFLPAGFDARAMNGAGRIVGNTSSGVRIWDGASLIDLGLGAGSYGYAINSRGDVAGALNGQYGQPFLYTSGALRHAGPELDEFQTGRVNGLNELGHVGSTYEGADTPWTGHAFLYQNGAMHDLGSLGGLDSFVNDINDARQILGKACRQDECLSVRLDLVPAVPEPGSYALLVAGLALLAVRRRRESLRFS